MYNDTITLFNRYKSTTGDMWYPTVLHNVNVNLDKSAVMEKSGSDSSDSAIVNIRYTPQDGKKVIGGKAWLAPIAWGKQSEDNLPKSMTFASGTKFDFFLVGEWGDGEPIPDSKYMPEGFYAYMKSQYDFVFAISGVSMFSVIPHFEVVGK